MRTPTMPSERDRQRIADHVYREIVWRIPLGLVVLKVEDHTDLGSIRVVAANPAALRMADLSADQVVGKTIREVRSEALRTSLPERVADVARTGVPQDLGYVRGIKDPNRTYALKLFPLPENSVGMIFEDVTHVQALADAEGRFAAALRASPLAMSIMRLADGALLDANARFLKLFGFARREELAGKRARDLGIWTDPKEYQRVVADIKRHREIREAPLEGRTRDGRKFRALVALETIRFEGQDCVLVLFWRT